MATMFTELTLPDLPRYATDAGETSEPSEAEKDKGAQQATASPAKEFNWLIRQNYYYCQQTIRTLIGNWFHQDHTIKPDAALSVIFHPDQGIWLIADSNGPTAWVSYNGSVFSSDSVIGLPHAKSIAIDSTYTLIGGNNGDIYRRNSSGTYTTLAAATIGGSSTLESMITKYPTSDLIIVNRNGTIRRNTTGAGGGSWVAATTQPPSPNTSSEASFAWTGGSTFYHCQAIAGSSKMYVSTDDGDNWATVTTNPFAGESIGIARDFAYNPDDSLFVAVGFGDSNDAYIEYSDDDMATWTAATIDMDGIPVSDSSDLNAVYYCGKGAWVAVGQQDTVAANVDPLILVSMDGINWGRANIQTENETELNDVHASSRTLIACGDDGATISLGTGFYNP